MPDEAPAIEALSAVTLAVSDMARSVRFYEALGFVRQYGGTDAEFTSYRAGPSFLNLRAGAAPEAVRNWGRLVFYVSDVDALYVRARAAGLEPADEPQDAPWGERYFHPADPDGQASPHHPRHKGGKGKADQIACRRSDKQANPAAPA